MVLNALVVTGHGINCEIETQRALEIVGFKKKDLVHLNFIVGGEVDLKSYQFIVFPGGFLDGDDLGAAQACANRIRHSKVKGRNLIQDLLEFVTQGGLILGICNGFQLLAKLGLVPAFDGGYLQRDVSLTGNESGRFEDRWVNLLVDHDSPCVFTHDLDKVYLPVRHGEGKVVGRDPIVMDRLLTSHQAVLFYTKPEESQPTLDYPFNPNGSLHGIAGICDPSGRIFGLMPHPECYLDRTNHPRWTRERLPEKGIGLKIFDNARRYILGS
ncbi:MAG: phosphoribosylformylglycinamidine synthase subunit PurQ [Desulfomonilaceae bacterium]